MINMRMWINNPVETSPWFHMRALHPHSFEVMRYFAGAVKSVAAFLVKGDDRICWSNAQVLLHFANGMVGCLQYSGSVTHSASASRLEVVGDSTYLLDAFHNDKVTLFAEDPFKSEWDVKQLGARMWGHHQQDEYFRRGPSTGCVAVPSAAT